MRTDGNYAIGIAIFVTYVVSRGLYFVSLVKDMALASWKLFSCRVRVCFEK